MRKTAGAGAPAFFCNNMIKLTKTLDYMYIVWYNTITAREKEKRL